MSDLQGHYKRTDNGKQSFFLLKLNLHTQEAKETNEEMIRTFLAKALEHRGTLQEEIDFTIEIARYYDLNGD